MPSQPPPNNTKTYPLQWVHIDDFSPGCYSAGHIAPETPTNSAPLGAAYLPGTYCCASIPGGALAPLPGIAAQYPDLVSLQTGVPYILVTGFAVTPFLNDNAYEVVIMYESDDGFAHFTGALSFVPGQAPVDISGPTQSSPSFAGFFGSPYPVYTRVGNADSNGNVPDPVPVLIWPSSAPTDPHGNLGHLWLYPYAGTYTAADLINTANNQGTGQVIAYGNRIICMTGRNYAWPTGGGVNTNENFIFTDPGETGNYGHNQNAPTVFDVESPWGYGAWGTISVGELFLIKKYGGGVLLNGDLASPSSTIREPGVQSTGDFVGQAASTPVGLVYCSQDQGAWLWNGGNTAQKISSNIHDNFFDLEGQYNIPTNNYGFNAYHWQKWVLFSGNVIMDTETQAWWNLFPRRGTNPPHINAGRDLWWYKQGQTGGEMIAGPLVVFSNTDNWVTVFDNAVPSAFYQWTSLPIHVSKDADRVIDVRQIVIRASDPTNTGGASVGCFIGSFQQASTKTISNNPTPIRFNVGNGAQGMEDIDLIITADNAAPFGSAPIIHSIDIGYIVRAGVAVND